MLATGTFSILQRTAGFCARHSVALLVTVGVECGLWTITYFALLLWAMCAGGGLGSPATYPLGLFSIIVAGTLDCAALLLPSTALAEWYQRRCGYGTLALLCVALTCLSFLACGWVFSARLATATSAVLFLLHLLPLGLYWWVVQCGPLLLSLLRKLRLGTRL